MKGWYASEINQLITKDLYKLQKSQAPKLKK